MHAVTQPAPAHRTPLPIRRALFVAAALLGAVPRARRRVQPDRRRVAPDDDRARELRRRAHARDRGRERRAAHRRARGRPLEVVTRVHRGAARAGALGRARRRRRAAAVVVVPGFFGGQCEVDYTIRVPSGTVVRAEADAGDVHRGAAARRPSRSCSTRRPATSTAIDVTRAVDRALVERGRRRGARPERGLASSSNSSAGDVVAVAGDAGAASCSRTAAPATSSCWCRTRSTASTRRSSAGDVDAGALRTDPSAARSITAHSSAGDVLVAAQP